MAKKWYLMVNPQIYNGGFEGEEWFNYAQEGFQEMLDTSMLCDNVEFINSDFSVIVPGKAIIQSVTPDTYLKAEDRQVLVPIGTLQKYAYIRHDGYIWLLASEPYNNKFYEKATLKICRNQLRWQNPATKKIYDYWYWCEDVTRYSSGVFNDRIFSTYDKQYHLMLPYDDNTQRLHDGCRFMMELSGDTPLVYEVTKFDGITGNNKTIKVLNLTLTQTDYDKSRDNVELRICDYYTTQENSINETDNGCTMYSRIDYENDEIKLSSYETFCAVFYDDKDNLIEQDTNNYSWSISNNNFDLKNLKITYKDNTVKIAVNNNRDLIGQTFKLNLLLYGAITATLTIRIVALW